MFRVVIPADVASTLRGLMLLDTACEQIVFRVSEIGIVLSAGEEDLDELVGYIAAEGQLRGGPPAPEAARRRPRGGQ